ncbi:50S ribosomal protein L1 [Candidatus Woesearchaeota archaeon]|nr:MAG: 50S ribosomal protein L1 [Candidatus Woesearchaeota archaeon]
MEKDTILKSLDELRKESKQRKFAQSADLIVNLQDLDFKKPTDQLDFFITLNHGLGKKMTVCSITGPEMTDESKRVCDFIVEQLEFDAYAADKKKVKRLARKYDFFIAQANIMPKVAQVFGRYLGPKNKMPNPKAGAVFPPKTNLQPLYDKLQKTIRIVAKKSFVLQVMIGKENQPDAELADNIYTVYDQLIHHLPKEKNNIKSMYIKFTMSKPVKLT